VKRHQYKKVATETIDAKTRTTAGYSPSTSSVTGTARQAWLRDLALGDEALLVAMITEFIQERSITPKIVKAPEVGLCMVPGRTGGTGAAFGLGEATVSRCVVEIDGMRGVGYVLGRSMTHAFAVAVADALLQGRTCEAFTAAVLEPIRSLRRSEQARMAALAAATKVDFFTLAREQ
jgi:alpha-D-ribose 1-methylphosphonate 5-triphosphate synthase subunit PhnG